MNPNITISDKLASREVQVGNIVKAEEKDLLSLYENLSGTGYFETGILPVDGTGVLSIRQAGNREQFVFQHAPGIYYMIWGKSERDKLAKQIHVAQPYRIVIGDHVNGQLRGARHFYSPVPITSLTQPLYHCNVPNLNCKGYSGTSVGWICLYHKEDYTGLPLGARIFKTVERASGHEAYNDANMSATDGARFYKAHYGQKAELSYLWDPTAWQQKSDKEGWEWTLDPDLWIPIKVAGIDSQDAHDPGGVVLTLEMAMYGNYKAYYPNSAPDEKQLSLMNEIARKDIKNPAPKAFYDLISGAFVKAKKKEAEKQPLKQTALPGVSGNLLTTPEVEKETPTEWVSQAPVFTPQSTVVAAAEDWEELPEWDPTLGWCVHCTNPVVEDDEYYYDNHENLVCKLCYETHYGKTDCCNQIIPLGDMFWAQNEGQNWCYSCHTRDFCDNCATEYLDAQHMIFGGHCQACAEPIYCVNCGSKNLPENIHNIIANEVKMPGVLGQETYKLCTECFQNVVKCACGLLKPDDTCMTIPATGQLVCEGCVAFNDQNEPVFVSIHS